MTRELIIDTEAEADLARARKWYEDRRNGLGNEFIEKFERTLDVIQRMPTVPRIVFRDLRRILLRRFPYAIFYRANESLITVVAVYHTSRDPTSWQSRA